VNCNIFIKSEAVLNFYFQHASRGLFADESTAAHMVSKGQKPFHKATSGSQLPDAAKEFKRRRYTPSTCRQFASQGGPTSTPVPELPNEKVSV
jgi:hypothetical protein